MNWNKIESILLDLDGTLLDLNFDLHFWLEYIPKVYSEKHNISFQDAKKIIVSRIESQEGKLTWYCLDFWEENLELDIMKLKKDISYLIQVHKYVLDFLNAAKENKKQIFLVTNAHRKGIDLKMEASGLQSYFDKIISSHDFGSPKQDQKFWIELANTIDFDKDRSIFFDDSLDVLEAASKFRIKNIVAINKPSTKLDKKNIPGFINIENFSEVMTFNSITN
ncbi:GMP/IMP nucleotidase [Candidatus Thioglobus sp. NP1]|uniref:GMP/IMP nucleotidase n=1 Tax=Candidatus Thioglobus sp. NP1 TaxID=2508687 RepID=UPI0020C56243|nr:GMP/IMP nucleotidase [Candidatus Thioglobus sp. NP1]